MGEKVEKQNTLKAEKVRREKLVHIIKREQIASKKALIIRVVTVILAFAVACTLVMLLSEKSPDPIKVFKTLFDGAFGTGDRIWNLLQEFSMLLCISLAVTPAFKMKFWNCGAEGQALVGGLATMACMHYLGDSFPLPLLFVTMIVASILAGAVWALIPAIFKARWNTNETLFTLMMNYMAIQLVAFFIKVWVTNGSGTVPTMEQYGLPVLFGKPYLLNLIVVLVLTVLFYVYFRFSKQGYEISVVGESENTARYIGINVKKVIIRTMFISGAVCGIAGLLLVGAADHTISTTTVRGRGFTAIMVSWLAKFNPLFMMLTTLLVVFLKRGSSEIESKFRVSSSISDIMVAIILLAIISCEFFLNYKVVFNKAGKEKTE